MERADYRKARASNRELEKSEWPSTEAGSGPIKALHFDFDKAMLKSFVCLRVRIPELVARAERRRRPRDRHCCGLPCQLQPTTPACPTVRSSAVKGRLCPPLLPFPLIAIPTETRPPDQQCLFSIWWRVRVDVFA